MRDEVEERGGRGRGGWGEGVGVRGLKALLNSVRVVTFTIIICLNSVNCSNFPQIVVIFLPFLVSCRDGILCLHMSDVLKPIMGVCN